MSIIDELIDREGCLDPDLVGVHHAKAGHLEWCRERGEGERKFIARVVRQAAASGYRLVHIAGVLQVDGNVVALRRPPPPDRAA